MKCLIDLSTRLLTTGGMIGTLLSPGLPTTAATLPSSQTPLVPSTQFAGLWHTIDVLEDVDDVVNGNFGQVDPVREVTESVGDALDDVNDTIYDVTHINPIEPFTQVDDQVEDFVDDVDDTMRHVSNDVNDWFN